MPDVRVDCIYRYVSLFYVNDNFNLLLTFFWSTIMCLSSGNISCDMIFGLLASVSASPSVHPCIWGESQCWHQSLVFFVTDTIPRLGNNVISLKKTVSFFEQNISNICLFGNIIYSFSKLHLCSMSASLVTLLIITNSDSLSPNQLPFQV